MTVEQSKGADFLQELQSLTESNNRARVLKFQRHCQLPIWLHNVADVDHFNHIVQSVDGQPDRARLSGF